MGTDLCSSSEGDPSTKTVHVIFLVFLIIQQRRTDVGKKYPQNHGYKVQVNVLVGFSKD